MAETNLTTCEHLQALEEAIASSGIAIAAKGDWWGSGSSRNIYFNCVLDSSAIREQFKLPEFVEWYEYDGRVAGQEAGFHCKKCNSLLVGGLAEYGGKVWPPKS